MRAVVAVLLFVTAAHAGLWGLFQEKQPAPDFRGILPSVSYTPFEPGHVVIEGIDSEKVRADLKKFSTLTRAVRLYSSSEGMLSADRAVHLLDRLGVPRAKVVIGSAFYARIFSNVAATNNGLFQPGTFKRTIPFSALENTIVPGEGWWWHRDEAAQAAYAYNGVLREFLTTDDAISVAAKARYVNSEGLGGIMFWQLVDDRKEGGLLGVMYRALRTP